MLEVDSATIDNDSHNMMKKVPEIEEALVFHVDSVPQQMSTHVTEEQGLINGVLFAALDISNEEDPIC